MVWFSAGMSVSCFCLTYIHGQSIINIYANVKYYILIMALQRTSKNQRLNFISFFTHQRLFEPSYPQGSVKDGLIAESGGFDRNSFFRGRNIGKAPLSVNKK